MCICDPHYCQSCKHSSRRQFQFCILNKKQSEHNLSSDYSRNFLPRAPGPSAMSSDDEEPAHDTNVPMYQKPPTRKMFGAPSGIKMPDPPDNNQLYEVPNGITDVLDTGKAEVSAYRFPRDSLTVPSWVENPAFPIWFFSKDSKDYWKTSRYNEETMKKYKEAIFHFHEQACEHQGILLKDFLALGRNSWKRYSKWTESNTEPGTYRMDMGKIKDFSKLPVKLLMKEVQRENPHWYKLHPCPNLQSDRTSIDPEIWVSEIEWNVRYIAKIKPATFAYIKKYIDDRAHCKEQPRLSVTHLANAFSHALTTFCRDTQRCDRHSNLYWTLVCNGQALTRTDGFDDLAFLPTACPLLADYLNEPVLICLNSFCTYLWFKGTHLQKVCSGDHPSYKQEDHKTLGPSLPGPENQPCL
jgi:hypothetical protein